MVINIEFVNHRILINIFIRLEERIVIIASKSRSPRLLSILLTFSTVVD